MRSVTFVTVHFGSVLTVMCFLLSLFGNLHQAPYGAGTMQGVTICIQSCDINTHFVFFALSFQVDMCAGLKCYMVYCFIMCKRVSVMM